MKLKQYIILAAAALALVGCQEEPKVEFGIDTNSITIGPEGGVRTVSIDSSDRWIASSNSSWITVSPANGRGGVDCTITIDSALLNTSRPGKVTIENMETHKTRTIDITQEGFPYEITLLEEEAEQKVPNYEVYGQREFSITVTTNVDFDVEIPEGCNWLSFDNSYKINLDRGIRPREVKIDFEWDINTKPEERSAEVTFVPKRNDILTERNDRLRVVQEASTPIEAGTRAGDSVALISIQRSLQVATQWESSIPMERWDGVVLWEEGQEGCTKENVGRVRKVEFSLMNTKEATLPFEFKYLTAADEIFVFGNTNTFLKDLQVGDELCELTQLRRLTLGAYGLDGLPENFKNLKNLEYLNICSNNLSTVPKVLTKENFPKLRSLIMNANQRSVIYDLSNTNKTDLCGFIEEEAFPIELLRWDTLDTLILSVNYLQGTLPDLKDDPNWPVYTEEDWAASNDTLPRKLVDEKIKKVLPYTKTFRINLNRLTGLLPEWLLYHPMLDIWMPYSLVFPQEGKDQSGRSAGFVNEPVNLDYYYAEDLYPFKDQPEGEFE